MMVMMMVMITMKMMMMIMSSPVGKVMMPVLISNFSPIK